MNSTAPAFDSSDPSQFPVAYDVEREEILIASTPAEAIASAAFLDQRLGVDLDSAMRLPWQQVDVSGGPQRLAMVFHTAFCGSTLLSRALQNPLAAMSLREPHALMRLAYAAPGNDQSRIDGPLKAVLQLLSRPWADGGICLIKPTNQVNNLVPAILRATRGNAILLYSSLPEFILSCVKKLPESQNYALWTARHLLRGSALQRTLDVPWDHPFHFVESCVLAWYAQMEIYADALAADSEDRLRSLDLPTLLAAPAQVVPACARWLGMGGDETLWQARAASEFQRHAKHTDRPYDAAARAAERAALTRDHGALIDAAMDWAANVVAPVARIPIDWKPLATSGATA